MWDHFWRLHKIQLESNQSAALSTSTETVVTVPIHGYSGNAAGAWLSMNPVVSSEAPMLLSKPLPISRPRNRSSRVLCSAVSRMYLIALSPMVSAIQRLLSESMP